MEEIKVLKAEQTLIGQLLNRNPAATLIMEMIEPECCEEQRHVDILSAICNIKPEDITLVSVTAELKKRKKLDEVGGVNYLADLANASVDDKNASRYWQLIRGKWSARQLINQTEEVSSDDTDNVNHPSHYTWLKDKCGIEVIDITRHLDFDLGNAVKYILRAGHKREEGMTDAEKRVQDLQKAAWYINDEINNLIKEK